MFLNMLIIRAGIHKLLGRISNTEDPVQTASSDYLFLFGRQQVFEILVIVENWNLCNFAQVKPLVNLGYHDIQVEPVLSHAF